MKKFDCMCKVKLANECTSTYRGGTHNDGGHNHTGTQRGSAGESMHLSGHDGSGQDPARVVWQKGLSGPPLPLLPLRIEVGWMRLALANKANYNIQ